RHLDRPGAGRAAVGRDTGRDRGAWRCRHVPRQGGGQGQHRHGRTGGETRSMMELLQRVFRAKSDRPIDYETSKRLAAAGKPAERREVAGNHTVRPELLYYLANDGDASVRAAVAANEATPVQADLLLARDGDAGVRVDLARKIAQLAPGLSRESHERLGKL